MGKVKGLRYLVPSVLKWTKSALKLEDLASFSGTYAVTIWG
jgi:hypothetical protein